jgi:hypothetical protein
MNTPHLRSPTVWLASAVTASGVGMAAIAASERSTGPDTWMLTILAVSLALGAHLLPGLVKRSVPMWSMWAVCVLMTLYGHTHFIVAAQTRASLGREAIVKEQDATLAVRQELDAIKARSQSEVAADIASQTAKTAKLEAARLRCEGATPGQCGSSTAAARASAAQVDALKLEAAQAEKADGLRSRLTVDAEKRDDKKATAQADPVDLEMSRLVGVDLHRVNIFMALAQSVALELLGALLWWSALRSDEEEREDAEDEQDPRDEPAKPETERRITFGEWMARKTKPIVYAGELQDRIREAARNPADEPSGKVTAADWTAITGSNGKTTAATEDFPATTRPKRTSPPRKPKLKPDKEAA